MADALWESKFPALLVTPYRVTSSRDVRYNCIAWAAGVTDQWWWPSLDGYWPSDAPRSESTEAFIEAYRTQGYELCSDGSLQDGVEKIVIFASSDKPTHAARQLPDGVWTSKCGKWVDISHSLEGVSGDEYGKPRVFMARTRLAD